MKEYDSITMFRRVGCGNIYCIFTEEGGEFYSLIIKGDNAKEASCGEVWFNSLSRILTYALRKSVWEGTAQKALVKHLIGNRCNMYVPNRDAIQSCPDAIGRMVLEYIKSRGLDEIEKEEEIASATRGHQG